MAGRNPSDGDDFERRWEAITESLGDLEVPAPFDGDDVAEAPAPAQKNSDGWGSDAGGRVARGPRDYEVSEDEVHFVPPDPVITRSGDPWRVAGWAGAALGAVGAFVCLLARSVIPTLWLQIACGLLAAGLIVVFIRLPARREPTDGDSGAQV